MTTYNLLTKYNLQSINRTIKYQYITITTKTGITDYMIHCHGPCIVYHF